MRRAGILLAAALLAAGCSAVRPDPAVPEHVRATVAEARVQAEAGDFDAALAALRVLDDLVVTHRVDGTLDPEQAAELRAASSEVATMLEGMAPDGGNPAEGQGRGGGSGDGRGGGDP